MCVDLRHEYLKSENYYESKHVGTRAKGDKTCECCFEVIKKGTPHLMHHFYPEFQAYATHIECENAFKESLIGS